jgi:hypothetical protein
MEVDEREWRKYRMEYEDMKERLRKIMEIVSGGELPKMKNLNLTPGCNCMYEGVQDPGLHQFGCPYGGSTARSKTLVL